MPYKDPEKARLAAKERKRRYRARHPGPGKGRHGNHVRGEEHPRWNDGRILSSHGYVKIRVGINHSLADANGYAYEHLLVWCSAGNAIPDGGEILHHHNHDKTDNRLNNLVLLKRGKHNSLHMMEMARDAKGRIVGKRRAGRLLDGREHNQLPGEGA